MLIEGHCPLTDSFVIHKNLVCIKFLQIIVIFPESPQTFTWGESQNPGEGGTLNVEVIGILVGLFLENPKHVQILILKS